VRSLSDAIGIRKRIEPAGLESLRGTSGLPHRPLSRQRHRPESFGAALRNGIFEPLWNRNYVDHVQITAAETLGVERRGGFYETTGALRDMIQSHVLQLTSLVAVEPRILRCHLRPQRKLKVLQSIRPFDLEAVAQSVVRANTPPERSAESRCRAIGGTGCNPGSKTETFVAAKLQIENWRWAGVPFYLRTGKAPGQTHHRDRYRIPPRAAYGFPRQAYRTESLGLEHPAR